MWLSGAAWRIQVSAATAERLRAAGGYRLRARGLVPVKGKGNMLTYWLLGKDGFDKPLPTPPPLQSVPSLYRHMLHRVYKFTYKHILYVFRSGEVLEEAEQEGEAAAGEEGGGAGEAADEPVAELGDSVPRADRLG